MKKPIIVTSSLKTIVNSLTEPSSASGKSICLWYAKSCCVMLVGNHWPLTLMSNWICWYLEALNNILFSAMSEIILILLFQFLKAQTDWPSNNCCEFSVCFLCPNPLLVRCCWVSWLRGSENCFADTQLSSTQRNKYQPMREQNWNKMTNLKPENWTHYHLFFRHLTLSRNNQSTHF